MILPPEECPSCSSKLEWVKDQLYCRNPNCGASNKKQVQHFATNMKIKGLGPAAIDKLGLSNIIHIYQLEEDEIIDLLESNKLGEKLYEQIQLSKNASLNVILPSLGIPLIGKSATEKLSLVCDNLFEINETVCLEAGLGEKATTNLLTWLRADEWYLDLPFTFEFQRSNKQLDSNKGTICITGKLKSYPTKKAAEDALSSLGYTIKSSLTKDVTILVNESGKETAKTQKARESGVLIVENLIEFIGE